MGRGDDEDDETDMTGGRSAGSRHGGSHLLASIVTWENQETALHRNPDHVTGTFSALFLPITVVWIGYPSMVTRQYLVQSKMCIGKYW
jgi:hypothetical protein